MTAKPDLDSIVCVSTMLNNVPVVVTGIHMGNVDSLQNEGREATFPLMDESGHPLIGLSTYLYTGDENYA